jgi:hypothetical protein
MIRSTQSWQIEVSIPAATEAKRLHGAGGYRVKSERLFGGDLARLSASPAAQAKLRFCLRYGRGGDRHIASLLPCV